MPVYDFSSGFNLLNQGINSLGEALGNRSDAEAYAGISDALSQGNYQQAMAKAFAAGKPDLALKIQGTALQYGQAGAAAGGFGGGAGAPAVPGDTTAATLKPPAAPGTEATPVAPLTVKPGVAPGYEAAGLARPDVVAMIRQEAQARNIDPDVAVRVAETEGLNNYTGDKGKSFGPYQLYTGGGLGNVFQQKTGLDPSDPRTLRQQIQFALDTAASQGSWHGWNGPKNAGMNMAAGLQNARPIGVGLQGRAGGPSAAGPVSAIDVPPGTPNQPGAAMPPVAQPAVAAATPPIPQGVPRTPQEAIALARAQAPALTAAAAAAQGQPPAAPPLAAPQPAAAPAASPLAGLLGISPAAAAPAALGPAAPAGPPGVAPPAGVTPLPPGVARPGIAYEVNQVVEGLNNGSLRFGDVRRNYQSYGLPDPEAPQNARLWQVLADASRQTTPETSAAQYAREPGPGAGPQPPAAPQAPQPPADTAAAFADRARRRQAFIDAQSAQGAAKDVPPEHTPAPVPPAIQPKSAANAPVEAPRIPVDYGRPPAPAQPPARPAALAPRGPAQGPYGPPGGPGSAFARDFGPGRGQMWGPQGGVIAAPGGVGPSQGPAPPGQPSILGPNASPYAQAALAAIQQGRMPGAPGAAGMPPLASGPAPGPGAAPAGLPPGAPAGAPGAAPGLGARLGGIGSGLINLLSLQPPGGIPGMPTAASYAQGRPTPPGGWGAPVPGGVGLPTAPPGLPPAALAAAGAPARPALIGDPNATPEQATRQAQTYAQASPSPLQEQALAMRRQQAWYGSLGNTGAAKAYGDEADKIEARIAEQEKQSTAAGYKTGEISAQAKADMAKDDYKAISANADTIRGPSGPLGLIKSVTEMKKQFDDLQDAGWGATGLGNLQATWDKALGVLGIFDQNAGRAATGQQEFNSLKAQELAQLATTLYANGHGRLNRQEFMALKEGNYDLKFRPEAIRAMLDYAEERGHMALDAYNRQIENFPRVHKGFMTADELDPLKVTQKERQAATTYTWAPRAPTQGQGSSAQSPTPVTTPQDAAKLPVGTWITVPGKPAPTQITQAFKDRYATPAAPAEAGAAP